MGSVQLRRLPSVADAIMALRLGQVDSFVTGRTSITRFLESPEGANYHTFIIPDTDENMALAISQRYPELAEELSNALCEMLEDGFIDQLREKWHVQ